MHGLVDTGFQQVGAMRVLDSRAEGHSKTRPAKAIVADWEKILRRHAFPAWTEGRSKSVLVQNRKEETGLNQVLI